MNRRHFITLLSAAPAAAAAIAASSEPATIADVEKVVTTPAPVLGDEWITIAHSGRNQNGHVYSQAALTSMRQALPGTRVIVADHLGLEFCEPSLAALAGVIMQARQEKDELQVRVNWFGSCWAGYLTPTGQGLKYEKRGDSLHIEEYRLEYVNLGQSSAFKKAHEVRYCKPCL